MRVYEMRDPTPIEAFVLAPDYDRAFEIFGGYLKTHGGDPDTLLYREWQVANLEGEARSVIEEAIALDRVGLVTCDAAGQWVFVTPLGDHKEAG